MMTREEYDERKRLIEQQHRTTIELIEAGRLAQLRALDQVWQAETDGGVTKTERGSGKPEPAPEPAKRRRVYELLEKIEAVLPSLPEVFDYNDLCRALGAELDRGAVRRNLQLLVEEEILGKEGTTNGRFRLLYRKLAPAVPQEDV
ncbi:MAG TPA: hypothetical protein VN851_07845 [Thermoanaerobaculia bacterium]|nr:hypothetical protein [Thermoanaerobaculia bacterium]